MIEHINFHGPEWAAIKRLLLDSQQKKTQLLIQATTHDESMKLRGALSIITEILSYEKAAQQSR
jgi:hypothetical protein